MRVVPNSGIFNDEHLDRARGDAIMATQDDGLPEPLVYYLRALEVRVVELQAEQKRRSLRDIPWKFAGAPQ